MILEVTEAMLLISGHNPEAARKLADVDEFDDAIDCVPDLNPPRCPYCDRVMSNREAIEQGACNDCNGGACEL